MITTEITVNDTLYKMWGILVLHLATNYTQFELEGNVFMNNYTIILENVCH